MTPLRALVPEAPAVVGMLTSDLAGYILEVLMSAGPTERGVWNRRNFCMQTSRDYAPPGQGGDDSVGVACSSAWAWLEANGFIARHYVHNKKMHEGASQSSIPNQPAEPLEQEVTKQVLDFLRSGTMLTQYWHRIQSINPGIAEPQAVVLILQRTAKIWDNYFDQVKSHIIRSLVERITLHEDDTVEVSWRTDNWIPLLETMKPKTVGAELLEMEMPA